jgi:hypothetical protein
MTAHRLAELIIGFMLIGVCAYSLHTGRTLSGYRVYSRSEEPRSFWAVVLITSAFGLMFLLGAVTWRK